jgi:hypothetical protein
MLLPEKTFVFAAGQSALHISVGKWRPSQSRTQ